MKKADKKTNFLSLDKKYSSLNSSKAVVIPVIYSENRKAKSNILNVPQEILKASAKLEHYDEEMGGELCLEKGIYTLGTLNLNKLSYQNVCKKLEKEISSLLDTDKTIAVVGGNHSLTFGALKAFSHKYTSLSLLHIDSKANLKQSWQSKSQHETLITRAAELNIKIVQVGIRSQSKEENDLRLEKKIHQYLACEIKLGMYGADWQELVNKDLTDKVYITIDLSGFDPSVIREVENPEPGGLLWDELMYLFKIVGQDRTIVGFDVMGFVPGSASSSYYFIAKLIYKIFNFALSKH
ncbi:MAG: arginase family protein [Bacteroidota bacterium]